MTDVGRMSVAEPVGKVLADQVGSGHPVASAIVASPSLILGQTDDQEARGWPNSYQARPARPCYTTIHDSTTTKGRARFHDPSRRGKMEH